MKPDKSMIRYMLAAILTAALAVAQNSHDAALKNLKFRNIGPATVYVAALGDLWGPNKERGVYKSTDGGATWTQTLAINENTGASDIAIDPQSPNILYAAAYERRRTVFGYNGGGPDGGLYRST